LGAADLSHARLAGATLTGAVPGNRADLTFADLRWATLTGAELGRTEGVLRIENPDETVRAAYRRALTSIPPDEIPEGSGLPIRAATAATW
jgi:hypothetical protein